MKGPHYRRLVGTTNDLNILDTPDCWSWRFLSSWFGKFSWPPFQRPERRSRSLDHPKHGLTKLLEDLFFTYPALNLHRCWDWCPFLVICFTSPSRSFSRICWRFNIPKSWVMFNEGISQACYYRAPSQPSGSSTKLPAAAARLRFNVKECAPPTLSGGPLIGSHP